ncbi:MAG: class I tRNA ligase family protein, partial [Deltaproteobacteria bacterium]|nr:class I tRNA ligase family protein [Deltaproteobacteria bacterium]
VFAKFKVVDAKKNLEVGSDKGTFFVIWTTTPWTLPANMAVAVNPRLTYCKVSTPAGELIINKELLANCMESFNFSESDYEIDAKTYLGSELEGIELAHPFIDRRVPVLLGDFVTTEAGTGCVHIAPGHGHDDYILGKKHGLEVYAPVNDFGKFTKDFPECEGQFVFKANSSIIELLRERDSLLGESDLTHSYPHCWRCKRPVIFRATAQWFISMEVGHLRKKALEVIDNVNWIPDWGKGRITSMVSGRPDWCLSRQRAWGVPIPALKCTPCEESFLDESLIAHLVKRFKEDGADIWFTEELSELLPKGIKCPRCGKDDLTKEEDILDVWFDSGVSFAAVLEERDYLNDKAELYLEGSDQHRGWFQSALLTSVGTRDTAPFKSVLTHGFVVDGKGRKMSKSLGNVIAPNLIIEKYGVEVLRLWVASEDYRDEMRISDE